MIYAFSLENSFSFILFQGLRPWLLLFSVIVKSTLNQKRENKNSKKFRIYNSKPVYNLSRFFFLSLVDTATPSLWSDFYICMFKLNKNSTKKTNKLKFGQTLRGVLPTDDETMAAIMSTTLISANSRLKKLSTLSTK